MYYSSMGEWLFSKANKGLPTSTNPRLFQVFSSVILSLILLASTSGCQQPTGGVSPEIHALNIADYTHEHWDELTLIHEELRHILEAKDGDPYFVADDATIDVVVMLDGEDHVVDHEDFTMELTFGSTEASEDNFVVNGETVTADEAHGLFEGHLNELHEIRQSKLRQREAELLAFLEQVGVEVPEDDPEHGIHESFDHLSGWARIDMTKEQILDLVLNHGELITSIDVFHDHTFGNDPYPASTTNANMATALDAIGVGSWWRDRPEVGIYMRDAGCFETSSSLPASRYYNPSDIAPESTDHPYKVAWTIGQTSREAKVLCGSDWYRPPTTLPAGFPAVKIANHSWGANSNRYNGESKATDEAVYDTGVATFVAAGNDGQGNINDKAAGYNVIAVGNWDPATGAMNTSSSSNVVPNTGVNKPDIAAPGTNIPSPWGNWSGTSAASPIAAGAAADYAGYSPGVSYAPTMKALMMLRAVRSATGTTHTNSNNRVLADRDGVGVINFGAFAGKAVSCHSYARSSVDASDVWNTTARGSSSPARHLSFNAQQGQKYRVSVSWLVDPNYVIGRINAGDPGRPNMDVDLRVFPPGSNSSVATSTSSKNNWELVEFTAGQTGTYTIELKQYSSANTGKMGMSMCYSSFN